MSLTVERHAEGSILALRLTGVIDESWNGSQAAAAIRADTVIIDLAGIRRISSFGIREWVDFIDAVSGRADVILVECSPKVIHQLNMVANFAGEARLYSFYAPYRCDYCDSERERLLRVDRDAEIIGAGLPPERPCDGCGELEYFDEDPATYFSFAAAAPTFELDSEIAGFLAARLSYETAPSARRLRADKQVEDTTTYLRLAGDLDGSFPAETVADGLEGDVILELSGIGRIDPAGAAAWRRFIDAVAPAADSILIAGAAPLFVEKLTGAADLGGARMISIGLPYSCERCRATSTREVDVGEHAAVLRFATPPELSCPDCASRLICVAGEELLARLPDLVAAEIGGDTRRQLARFRGARADRKPRPAAAPRRRGSWLALGAALIVAGAAGAALLAHAIDRDGDPGARAGAVRASAIDPPAWAADLAPLTGRCRASGGGQICAASSTLALSEQQASEQAQLVAVDEMAWALGWGDQDAGSRRARLLGRLSDAGDPLSPQFRQLAADRIEISRGVAEAVVRAGGGTLDPDLFVETWTVAGERRFRAYARLAIDDAATRALNEAIAETAASELGVTAASFPPALVWRHRDVRAGALLREVRDGPLADLGLRRGYVVTAVQGQNVEGAAGFVELLEAEIARLGSSGGQLRMVVHTGSGEPMTFVREWKPPAPPARPAGVEPPPRPTFNTWEEAGGDPREDPRR